MLAASHDMHHSREVAQASLLWKEHCRLAIRLSYGGLGQVDLLEVDGVLFLLNSILPWLILRPRPQDHL